MYARVARRVATQSCKQIWSRLHACTTRNDSARAKQKYLKTHGEIRVFAMAVFLCACNFPARFPNCTRRISRECCLHRAHQHDEKILHRWRCVRVADDRNRSKTSESAPTDSLRFGVLSPEFIPRTDEECRSVAENILARAFTGTILQRCTSQNAALRAITVQVFVSGDH